MAKKRKRIGDIHAAILISIAVLIDVTQVMVTLIGFVVALIPGANVFAIGALVVISIASGQNPLTVGLVLMFAAGFLSLLILLCFQAYFTVFCNRKIDESVAVQVTLFTLAIALEPIPILNQLPLLSAYVITTISTMRNADDEYNKKQARRERKQSRRAQEAKAQEVERPVYGS